jgi:hypothetical protein
MTIFRSKSGSTAYLSYRRSPQGCVFICGRGFAPIGRANACHGAHSEEFIAIKGNLSKINKNFFLLMYFLPFS